MLALTCARCESPCEDCEPLDCVGSCAGRECGDDGCGASCGICAEGQHCSSEGLCLPVGCDCRGGQASCDGPNLLRACADGCAWTEIDCGAFCASRGFAASVGCGSDEAGAQSCLCTYFSGWGVACVPDERACPVGSDTCISIGEAAACSKACTKDADCENVAPGTESCTRVGSGAQLCAVFCTEDAECLPGTQCHPVDELWGLCLGEP